MVEQGFKSIDDALRKEAGCATELCIYKRMENHD